MYISLYTLDKYIYIYMYAFFLYIYVYAYVYVHVFLVSFCSSLQLLRRPLVYLSSAYWDAA